MAQELIKVEQLQYALQQVKTKTDAAITDAESRCVAKVEGKDLVSTTDIAQITTNKTDIDTLKGSEAVEGSVDYKIAQAIAGVDGNLEDYVKTEDLVYATNDNIDTMINGIYAKPLTE